MYDDDWDLHAVVRSCSASTTDRHRFSTSNGVCGVSASEVQNPFPPTGERRIEEELKDLCMPFISDLKDPHQKVVESFPISQRFTKQKLLPFSGGGAKSASSKSSVRRSKKRKSSMKKQVCRVDADKLSSDGWCWRKYGQKPIKGSPFPRGYYRCSSTKSCVARKQVEKDRSDPDIFLVTYTAEHSHPPPISPNSPTVPPPQKPTPEVTDRGSDSQEGDADNGDFCGTAEMADFDDDFFVRMEDFFPVTKAPEDPQIM